MTNVFETIKPELMEQLSTRNEHDIRVINQICEGLSGASVYKVELIGECSHKGFYFLKIDQDSAEFDNSIYVNKFVEFNKTVLKFKFDGYYILLIRIAGNSSLEYIDFYSIDSSRQQPIISYMFSDLMNKLTNKKDLIGKEVSPISLFDEQLGSKLRDDGIIYNFLQKNFLVTQINDYSSITFMGSIFPDPFAHSKRAELWKNHLLHQTKCIIHGDLHGNNIFVPLTGENYQLIDLSHCSDKGYLFYDNAYFELSLLLKGLEKYSIADWVKKISEIAENSFGNLEFPRIKALESLKQTEDLWIAGYNAGECSYYDSMKVAQLVARVIAGLNYSGKSKVSEEIRLRSYLFAAIYLDKLFKLINFCDWKSGNTKQFILPTEETKYHEIGKSCGNFDNEQRYILVVGDKFSYSDWVLKLLSRINWSGVISFDSGYSTKELKCALSTRDIQCFTNNVPSSCKKIEKGDSLWWVNAKGVNSVPESLSPNAVSWKKNNLDYIEKIIDSIDLVLAPNEINLIIDLNSFDLVDDISIYIMRILERFDRASKIKVIVKLLDKRNCSTTFIKQNELEMQVDTLVGGLDGIAQYCYYNMSDTSLNQVYIPNITSYIGIPLDDVDLAFIHSQVVLVHNGLANGRIEPTGHKNGFYFGESIFWAAIDEHLYVDRIEINDMCNKIREYFTGAEKYVLHEYPHAPGAGATVICKVACWRFRNELPTIILSTINEKVFEALTRIYSLSGKHLLILIDGDYSRTDVMQLKTRLESDKIKCIIIFSYRQYSYVANMLDVLTGDEPTNFEKKYGSEVNNYDFYSDIEINRRLKNLSNLTRDIDQSKFRLPFFYGFYAFEKDFVGIDKYLNDVLTRTLKNDKIREAINFIAIVTCYTADKNIHFKYINRLLDENKRTIKDLLKVLNGGDSHLVGISGEGYRFSHPVLAKLYLEKSFSGINGIAFRDACISLIEKLIVLDSYGNHHCISNELNELFMALFLKREVESIGDEDDIKEKRRLFSQIILDMQNNNLQLGLFKTLVKAVPENAHFHQHYGRLIISNNSNSIYEAKEQFDKAIEFDNKNSFHYHARGNMYSKYVRNILIGSFADYIELYNSVKDYTDLAIDDFTSAIANSIESNLVYPYSSAMFIITLVIRRIFEKSCCKSRKEFYSLNNEVSKWCDDKLALANSYDSIVEYRYRSFLGNSFYRVCKSHLKTANLSLQELLQAQIINPLDSNLKHTILHQYSIDKSCNWDQKAAEVLRNIYQTSNDLILLNKYDESVLWNWFNAYIRNPSFDYTSCLGALETLKDIQDNLTANFLLYIVYFCRYVLERDKKDAELALSYIEKSRMLSNKKIGRTYPLMFLGNVNRLVPGIVHKPKLPGNDEIPCLLFDAHIIGDSSRDQGENLSLDIDPRFKAFFVPYAEKIKKYQTTNMQVKTEIGFSYDGLRAWNLDPYV